MNEIRKVFFRAENSDSDYGGENQRNWFGENSYEIGEPFFARKVTKIDTGFAFNSQTLPVVRVWTEEYGKVCEIPWHMVCRLYYK